jgi:hypothetical protein
MAQTKDALFIPRIKVESKSNASLALIRSVLSTHIKEKIKKKKEKKKKKILAIRSESYIILTHTRLFLFCIVFISNQTSLNKHLSLSLTTRLFLSLKLTESPATTNSRRNFHSFYSRIPNYVLTKLYSVSFLFVVSFP